MSKSEVVQALEYLEDHLPMKNPDKCIKCIETIRLALLPATTTDEALIDLSGVKPCKHCKGKGYIETDKMTLGEYLRHLREESGMTLRQVEQEAGVSNSLISQIENEKIQNPGIRTLYGLAKVYNTDIAVIAGYVREK